MTCLSLRERSGVGDFVFMMVIEAVIGVTITCADESGVRVLKNQLC